MACRSLRLEVPTSVLSEGPNEIVVQNLASSLVVLFRPLPFLDSYVAASEHRRFRGWSQSVEYREEIRCELPSPTSHSR